MVQVVVLDEGVEGLTAQCPRQWQSTAVDVVEPVENVDEGCRIGRQMLWVCRARVAEDTVAQVEIIAALPRVGIGLDAQEVAQSPHK